MGVLVLVYDHDTRALADELTGTQHENHGMITAALHEYTCLEVIPMWGSAKGIPQIDNRLLSIKSVCDGQLVPATGKRLR